MKMKGLKNNQIKKKASGKGNDVVAVHPDTMSWLREYKKKTGISIVHFVAQAIADAKEKILAKE